MKKSIDESTTNDPQNHQKQKENIKIEAKFGKMEPRGGKNRIEARKMIQDGARQPPTAAMVAHPRLWCKAGAPFWRPKLIKIGEKMI